MRRRRRARKRVFEIVVRFHPETPGRHKFGVSVPALPGCFSDGRTREEAIENVREAIALYLSALEEHGREERDLVEVAV